MKELISLDINNYKGLRLRLELAAPKLHQEFRNLMTQWVSLEV